MEQQGDPRVDLAAAAQAAKASLMTKTCFCCGVAGHLKTTCPVPKEMRRIKGYLANLKDPECLMDCQRKDVETMEKEARLASLTAQCAAAKERPVSPEQLIAKLGVSFAEASKALTQAKAKLVGHEAKV